MPEWGYEMIETCPHCNSIKVVTIRRINNGCGDLKVADENNPRNFGKAEFRKRCEDCGTKTKWFLKDPVFTRNDIPV